MEWGGGGRTCMGIEAEPECGQSWDSLRLPLTLDSLCLSAHSPSTGTETETETETETAEPSNGQAQRVQEANRPRSRWHGPPTPLPNR